LVLAVGGLGPACGRVTDDATNDAAGGSGATPGAGGSDDGDIDDGQLPGGGGSGGTCMDSWSDGGALLDGPSCPGSGGACEFQTGDVQPCPDICTAVRQAKCEEPSAYELSSIQYCGGGINAVRVSWSGETGGLTCDYVDGDWVGVHQYSHTTAFCDDTSTDIRYGEQLPDCAGPEPQACAGATTDTGGGTGEGGAPPDVPPSNCYSDFSGVCGPCCPTTPPDCSDKPNGYPGYGCIAGFCSCGCNGGEWSCAC